MLVFMVPLALGAVGWIGGDDANIAGSLAIGEPEPDDEEDPGFLAGVPTWLVIICAIVAIGGFCGYGAAMAFAGSDGIGGMSGAGGYLVMFIAADAILCAMFALVVLAVAALVT